MLDLRAGVALRAPSQHSSRASRGTAISQANWFLSLYAGVLTLVFLGGVVYANEKRAAAADEITGEGNKRIVMHGGEDGESRISVLDANGKTVKKLLP